MLPSHKIKVLQIDINANTGYSKTSYFGVPHLLAFDETSKNAYGILFHDDAFVFGVTDFVYEEKLSTQAGFLMNTEKYRLRKFIGDIYNPDDTFDLNEASQFWLYEELSDVSDQKSIDDHVSFDIPVTT